MEEKLSLSSNRNALRSVRQIAVPLGSPERGILRTIAALGLVPLAVWVARDFLMALS